MSKITRQTFIQFGINVNAAADICEFGTPATGTPVYTNVIATLQALSAWTTGWAAETIANNRPFLEDMNAVCYVFSYMIAYILQMGIPEWDAGTTYYTNSLVQSGGLVYQSLIDININITPTVGANWKLFSQYSGQFGAWLARSSGTVYQAATDGYVVGYGALAVGALLLINTDANPSPSTTRVFTQITVSAGDANGSMGTGTCPVRKGDYWIATGTGTSWTSLFWLPIGS